MISAHSSTVLAVTDILASTWLIFSSLILQRRSSRLESPDTWARHNTEEDRAARSNGAFESRL